MINDAGRMPGRGGSGAVMGHMKLKAIVVRGTGRVDLAEPATFRAAAVGVNKLNATSPQVEGLRVLGTPRVMDNNWPLSDIPTKNFALGIAGSHVRQPRREEDAGDHPGAARRLSPVQHGLLALGARA